MEQTEYPIIQSELEQFMATAQGGVEASIEAANEFDNQGSRSY
jgi:hypothetical protein